MVDMPELIEQIPATLTAGCQTFFRTTVSVGKEIVVKYSIEIEGVEIKIEGLEFEGIQLH